MIISEQKLNKVLCITEIQYVKVVHNIVGQQVKIRVSVKYRLLFFLGNPAQNHYQSSILLIRNIPKNYCILLGINRKLISSSKKNKSKSQPKS